MTVRNGPLSTRAPVQETRTRHDSISHATQLVRGDSGLAFISTDHLTCNRRKHFERVQKFARG